MENISEKTATELFQIIYLMPKNNIKKIPIDFINLLHKKKSNNWEVIDNANNINVNNLNEDTKEYLAYIYLNYILEDEEKENYKRLLKENQEKYEKKVDISNIFAKKNLETDERLQQANKNSALVIVKKNFFEKILEKIKKIIKNLR